MDDLDNTNASEPHEVNQAQPDFVNEGMPRLRKIKRPKMHQGPIQTTPEEQGSQPSVDASSAPAAPGAGPRWRPITPA